MFFLTPAWILIGFCVDVFFDPKSWFIPLKEEQSAPDPSTTPAAGSTRTRVKENVAPRQENYGWFRVRC